VTDYIIKTRHLMWKPFMKKSSTDART